MYDVTKPSVDNLFKVQNKRIDFKGLPWKVCCGFTCHIAINLWEITTCVFSEKGY